MSDMREAVEKVYFLKDFVQGFLNLAGPNTKVTKQVYRRIIEIKKTSVDNGYEYQVIVKNVGDNKIISATTVNVQLSAVDLLTHEILVAIRSIG